MITTIDTRNYSHQRSSFYNNENHDSAYNHNYYESNDGDIILEICDDDSCYEYYRINQIIGMEEFLGIAVYLYGGIFDEDYDGFPYRVNGIIELNSEFC